jgi:chromosome partitioning protein
MRFLDSLGIPIIAVLRDSQNFVRSAEQGVGLVEMQPSRVRPDVEQLERIVSWLDGWTERRRNTTNVTGIRRQPSSRISILRKPQVSSA